MIVAMPLKVIVSFWMESSFTITTYYQIGALVAKMLKNVFFGPKIGHFPGLIKHFHGSFMCVFITVVSPVVICMRKSYISCVALPKKIKYHEWDTLYFRSLRSEVM